MPAQITDKLSEDKIQQFIDSTYADFHITILPVTESTNILVRELAVQGAEEGVVIMTEEQTAGRGRRGRSFFSPSGTGLYMSILLRPENMPVSEATKFTTMAAVSMCQAIEEVCGCKTGIKWVNDIFVNGRKVCGILTEAFLDGKTGLLDYAVLGAGVNVYVPERGFPSEIEQSAGALLDVQTSDIKNRLAASFINCFWRYYKQQKNSYVDKYREKSLAIGREITVLGGKDARKAFAYDVDEACRLLVRYEDGETEALSNGEISIKL